jgi:hypothetical protein
MHHCLSTRARLYYQRPGTVVVEIYTDYAEEYHLFKDLRVYLDIGRYIEDSTKAKMSTGNDVVLPEGRA